MVGGDLATSLSLIPAGIEEWEVAKWALTIQLEWEASKAGCAAPPFSNSGWD
jgi:hypothetical protein